MKFQFNKGQLSRAQKKSLLEVLNVLQTENKNELIVTPVEFPIKFRVKLDDDIEMMVGWNPESDGYSGLTTPEPTEPEPTEPEPEPEPELVKSEVGQRVDALALALVKLTMPLNTYQRGEVWIQFCTIYVKGIME